MTVDKGLTLETEHFYLTINGKNVECSSHFFDEDGEIEDIIEYFQGIIKECHELIAYLKTLQEFDPLENLKPKKEAEE